MGKSIEKIWNEAFVNEKSLTAPRINNIYNQKSKSLINKIKKTYEFDNKGLIPMAIIVAVGGVILSEVIIGFYGAFLIVCLYLFNSKLLQNFTTIDVKSDNLTYLKEYRNIITSISKATKNLFIFAIPLAVLSIFTLAFLVKEKSFFTRYISTNPTLLEILTAGLVAGVTVGIIGFIIFKISNRILYHSLISKLDDIIKEMEELKK